MSVPPPQRISREVEILLLVGVTAATPLVLTVCAIAGIVAAIVCVAASLVRGGLR